MLILLESHKPDSSLFSPLFSGSVSTVQTEKVDTISQEVVFTALYVHFVLWLPPLGIYTSHFIWPYTSTLCGCEVNNLFLYLKKLHTWHTSSCTCGYGLGETTRHSHPIFRGNKGWNKAKSMQASLVYMIHPKWSNGGINSWWRM